MVSIERFSKCLFYASQSRECFVLMTVLDVDCSNHYYDKLIQRLNSRLH